MNNILFTLIECPHMKVCDEENCGKGKQVLPNFENLTQEEVNIVKDFKVWRLNKFGDFVGNIFFFSCLNIIGALELLLLKG